MAKKGRRVHRSSPGSRPTPLALLDELAAAEALIRRKQWTEAREALLAITERYPKRADALAMLLTVAVELKDMPGYQDACERLIALTPNDPDLTLGLAGAYVSNVRLALARRTFRRFLERWPNHARAAEARDTLGELEHGLTPTLEEIGLSGDDAFDLAEQHEEAQVLLERGEYAAARHLLEQLLRRKPDFVAALNNLSLLESLDGQWERAESAARRVLALEPANVHALSNLTRYLCLSGRVADAGELAQRLKAAESDRFDVWLKKAEALSYLGDDQGVLDAFHRAETEECVEPPFGNPLIIHLAAVASLRQGRETEARRLWKRAIKVVPTMEEARDNLADLAKPAGERHGPWPFPLANWIPETTFAAFAARITRVATRSDQAIAQATRRALREQPALAALVPLLLDRGDPEAREFALNLATITKTPDLLAALRDFALSQRGPDALRQRAAQAATEAGLLPRGATRMWLQGEWRETLLLGFEIHGEPLKRTRSPRAERLFRQAMEALREDHARRAESLLEQALAFEPDAPDVLNNLGVACQMQGRTDEVEATLERNLARNPDYLFARTAKANLHIKRGQTDAAAALLEPLLSRSRFHFSEFAALCASWIDLSLARGERAAAQSWLDMWASVDPDHPAIEEWRARLDKRALLGGLARLLGGQRRAG